MKRILVSILLLTNLTVFPIAQASAESVENCRIKASERHYVSLGFPVAPERLANFAKPKILVIPFKLKDNPDYSFTSTYKKAYETAASNIAFLSNNKTTPEFIVLPPIATDFTNSTMNSLKANQTGGNQSKDESISTWGFVRKFISEHDSKIDFTGINGVVLEGSSTSISSNIAEAMMMTAGAADPYYRPIETGEGRIFNTVLLDKHVGSRTITHEVMHLYGLTDLYGSSTGPRRLSLMAEDTSSLLTYEKWVLGWLPDSEVQCINNPSDKSITRIIFNYAKTDQLLVVRTSGDKHYIIETSKLRDLKKLVFYSLNNDSRPPIEVFNSKELTASEGLNIDNIDAIGTQIISPVYTLLVSDINASSLVVNLVPEPLTRSTEFATLIKQAGDLKIKYQTPSEEKVQMAPVVKKKTTIICVKGKLTKKVTAMAPKCPSGYKKK